jgi:glycosyltransferase involved in cell wall biosynthesis
MGAVCSQLCGLEVALSRREVDSIFLSLVVPAYNEEKVIDIFFERTVSVLSKIDENFEIIVVDDGSCDATAELVKNHHLNDSRIKLIQLSRNFGKEIAMTAGLDLAAGEVVVIIDADLQDPPELIPKLVEKWSEGYDSVFATRTVREGETFFKKMTASCFYRVINMLSRVQLPANTGDFRLLSRRTVEAIRLLRERHRFMKGIFSWVGYKQTCVPYVREPRAAGETKWSYWRLWNFAIEGISSFSYIPLQTASYLGVLVAFLSFCYGTFLIFRTLIVGVDVPGYPSLMVTVLFLGGVQLIFLGMIGEYLGRMSNEAKKRPLYLVQDLVGFIPAEKQDKLSG